MIWSDCCSLLKAVMIIIDWIYFCFFVFYPISRIYRWSITSTFILRHLQCNKLIRHKITTSHWCFQYNLISFQKWFKKFFSNFICFIINHDFYIITLWMHFTLFINVIKRNKAKVCWYLVHLPACRFSPREQCLALVN